MCVGWGPDSHLQIIESINPEEGEGLWRWSLGDYLRVMNELKKRKKNAFIRKTFIMGET